MKAIEIELYFVSSENEFLCLLGLHQNHIILVYCHDVNDEDNEVTIGQLKTFTSILSQFPPEITVGFYLTSKEMSKNLKNT
ncbi:16390_t:CDS:2 [Dentiscutata erythropus]|uniref:16390_t:CDS:1 n=1 Tax=Dentiscutata erythropus TaxID=1348616 RepID=A0A9N9A6F2_9GLOM|nr:16390_t:CDS:2 [Dentiscutata erythropus]